MEAYLGFRHISKTFPGVIALDDITWDLQAGKVHGLVGENGAGKSTLLKILSGTYMPSSGTIQIGKIERVFKNTREAIHAGIAIIYQELNVVPDLSVADNLMLGNFPNHFGFIDKSILYKMAKIQLEELGEDFSLNTKLKSLSIGQRQMVEIGKALMRNAKVIAFDEPTSSLSEREVSKLFDVIRKLRAANKVIIYVTHRLDEIYEICDTITVFRDGKLISIRDKVSSVAREQIVADMVGRPLGNIYQYRPRKLGEKILAVRNLQGPGLSAPISFELRAGEILGFFGLIGAGRTELLKALYGATKASSGTIEFSGQSNSPSIRNSISKGLMFCPEDRKKEGIIPILSVQENMVISVRRRFNRAGIFVNSKKEQEITSFYIDKLKIKTPSQQREIRFLSGGNQQKVILSRWLAENVKILMLDEPTRGIDVGSKSEIYNLIFNLAESGVGIIVVSSELPEVLGLSDRIIVMRSGQAVATVYREEASQEKLLSLALPVS